MVAPNGPLLGALRVDVDPLVVAGGLGELIDPRLLDGQPVGGAEGAPDRVGQVVEGERRSRPIAVMARTVLRRLYRVMALVTVSTCADLSPGTSLLPAGLELGDCGASHRCSRVEHRMRRGPRLAGESLQVALLTYRGTPTCGGQGVYIRHLSRELVALGHRVEVFSGQPYPVLDPGVELTKVPSLDLYREPDPFRVPWPKEFKSPDRSARVRADVHRGLPRAADREPAHRRGAAPLDLDRRPGATTSSTTTRASAMASPSCEKPCSR